MSASDNLSHEQLAMFMPAHEIMSKTGEKSPYRLYSIHPIRDEKVKESTAEMWDRKAKEAKSDRLTSSIKKKGIKKPVCMMPFMGKHILTDGHHRVAAAHSIDPNYLVPVKHE
jgi:hypothetical protein